MSSIACITILSHNSFLLKNGSVEVIVITESKAWLLATQIHITADGIQKPERTH